MSRTLNNLISNPLAALHVVHREFSAAALGIQYAFCVALFVACLTMLSVANTVELLVKSRWKGCGRKRPWPIELSC